MININNMIINTVVRGTLFDKATNEVYFSIDNIADASLECGGETVYAVDAKGIQIAGFDRSKSATFSGSNALFNFDLMAAQLGSDKTVASEAAKIVVPKFELIDVKDAAKVTLAETPIDTSVKFIYSTHADKSKNQKFARGTAASATEFAINGSEITLPTDAFKVGDRVAVWYDVESATAQEIKNTTKHFAKGGKFVLEVLVAEPCNPTHDYYAYIIFNNAKLDNNFTLDFNTEATHAFSISAMQDYCSAQNELFSIIIAE